MKANRLLVVTADDFGIGPATSRGILELAERGAVTSTVLLVNSRYAADAVAEWRAVGGDLELGWHPCLTLDRPILPPRLVPTLVDEAGGFRPLGAFVKRLVTGRVARAEIEAELAAQLNRFVALVGRPPANINAHHHVHAFAPVGAVLRKVLAAAGCRPFVRRVAEPWRTLATVPGARVKRAALSAVGRMRPAGHFPCAGGLAGVTDPPFVHDPRFFVRWLERVPGRVVELACHPGHYDESLIGRDGTPTDGLLDRRPQEWRLLADPRFLAAAAAAGFRLVPAAAASSKFKVQSSKMKSGRRSALHL
jgi:predicted glycoside hydrolase/deacetylase ChbG (UPF0249 family)